MSEDNLNKIVKEITGIDTKISEMASERNERLTHLREQILKGESTGDIIRDFVIAQFGMLSERAEKPYRELCDYLHGGEGTPVLVVEERKEDVIKYMAREQMLPPMGHKITKTDLQLGVLASTLKFDIPSGGIILPMEKHARAYNLSRWRNGGWMLQDGPIKISGYSFGEKHFSIDILAGSLPEHNLLVLHGADTERYISERWLEEFYVEGMNLLGAKAPEGFHAKYNESFHKRKIGVLNELENALAQEIIEGNKGHNTEGIKDKIRAHLKEAVELGMHEDHKMETRWPGTPVSAYIESLCGKYDMPLSAKNNIKPV